VEEKEDKSLIYSLKLNQIDSNLISNNMVKFNLGLI
jgi:hypothetical protein